MMCVGDRARVFCHAIDKIINGEQLIPLFACRHFSENENNLIVRFDKKNLKWNSPEPPFMEMARAFFPYTWISNFIKVAPPLLPLFFPSIEPCHRRQWPPFCCCAKLFVSLWTNDERKMTMEKIQSAKWQHSSGIDAINDKWQKWTDIEERVSGAHWGGKSEWKIWSVHHLAPIRC